MLIATPRFSYWERSGGVQQRANLAEQFTELEWTGFHRHFTLLAKGGPTPRRFL